MTARTERERASFPLAAALFGLLCASFACVERETRVRAGGHVPAAPAGARLRVLTWNVKLFGAATLGLGNTTARDPRRAVLIGEALARQRRDGLDLALLQEVWDDALAEELIAAAGFAHAARGSARDRRGDVAETYLGSGLLALSRHPLEDVEQHAFAAAVGYDAFTSKGFLLLTARFGGLPVGVVTTHFHAGGAGDADETRLKQAEHIGRAVDRYQREHPGIPVIVAGDFNTHREDPRTYGLLVDALSGSGPLALDAYLSARSRPFPRGDTVLAENTLRTWLHGRPRRSSAIDFAFVRPAPAPAIELSPVRAVVHRFVLPAAEPPLARYEDGRGREVDVIDLSDHQAVQVWFQVRAGR